MPDLLVEIGTEEIPASYLEPAATALGRAVAKALGKARIPAGEPTVLWTPRRLSVHLADVADRGESRTERRTGPAARIAFDDDGNPTKAALGFARSAGVDPADLAVEETEKGPYVVAEVTDPGEPTSEVVARALAPALASVPFPKTMRWTGSPSTFARPIRSVLALYGADVVPAEAAGLVAGRRSTGHPFLAPEPFDVADADLAAYREALRERKVIVDPAERRQEILDGLAEFPGGARAAAASEDLLEEVVGLTEWPVVIEGRIDPEYLELPFEVLEVSMRVHLRFFPVVSDTGAPEPRFLAVMNREPSSADTVREGNERVLRARLTDGRFFFGEDRKRKLEAYVPRLADKALHRELGSYQAKVERVGELGRWLARELGRDGLEEPVERAALLAKADLETEMVGEFPELQGTMGRIYATLDGEPEEVARAIEDHYRPRGPEDRLPGGELASLLAVADKVDDLVAFFSIGGAPTGSSDPFGLRRQALGVIRIAFERELGFPLGGAFAKATELLGAEDADELAAAVAGYLKDRLYQVLTDAGFRYDLVRACLAAGFDDLPDLRIRVQALAEIAGGPDWPRLVELFERTSNITRGVRTGEPVDASLFEEDAEGELLKALDEHEPKVRELLDARDYPAVAALAVRVFAEPVHDFFETVFVNVEDERVRANRIELLGRVNDLFGARVADLSRVEKDAAGVIDLHSHYLPDVDDGPRSLEETLEMLRVAEEDGTEVLVATPHQRHPAGYDVPAELARSRFETVQEAARQAGIGIELRLGAEIHFSEEIPEGIRCGELLPLSSNGRYFLFELPVTTIPGNIFDVVFEFQTKGLFPVLAHPERNFEVMGNPSVARKLHDQGVLIQVTAMSVTGAFGRKSEKAAKKLLKWGAVDVIASDTHNRKRRPPGLSAAVRQAAKWVGPERAEEMVTTTPERILLGEGVL